MGITITTASGGGGTSTIGGGGNDCGGSRVFLIIIILGAVRGGKGLGLGDSPCIRAGDECYMEMTWKKLGEKEVVQIVVAVC